MNTKTDCRLILMSDSSVLIHLRFNLVLGVLSRKVREGSMFCYMSSSVEISDDRGRDIEGINSKVLHET